MPVSFEEDTTDRLASLEYRTAVDEYMRDEVLPYVPDAWVDYNKTKIGYEIPLTRHFYKYVPPRPLAEIDAEIKGWRMRFRVACGGGRLRTLRLKHVCEVIDVRAGSRRPPLLAVSIHRGVVPRDE